MTAVIITICSLLIIAYIFDLTSSKTKIPSVILLLGLGWAARQATYFFNLDIPDLNRLLPLFGTIGLILIVLEGSLEVELNKSQLPLLKKSVFSALFPMVGLSLALAFVFQYFGHYSFKDSLINAIPLCIISSAIAIPSVKNSTKQAKEFVIYESSFSDIFGVVLFDFFLLNETISWGAFGHFGLQLVIIIAVSFVATLGLSFLLSKIDHHIKFAPIVILVILTYVIAKHFHLPALIFIMLFGLFLGNLDELQRIKWIKLSKPEELNKEVHKLRELVVEGTFLIRSLFFLLFGFLINTAEITNMDTLYWALGIVAVIFIIRFIQLKALKVPLQPLLLIAPRGLITILLFLAITPEQAIPLVNKSLIIQIIILTALIMMIGLMTTRSVLKPKADKETLTA